MINVAVALFHGMGSQSADYADGLVSRLQNELSRRGCGPSSDGARLVWKSIHWGPVLAQIQADLAAGLDCDRMLNWRPLRSAVVETLGDVVAYQASRGPQSAYDEVHLAVAKQLRALADEAGQDSPLCVIAHSLGAVVADDYFRNLQSTREAASPEAYVSPTVRQAVELSPLASGQTLATLITLGSPLALWNAHRRECNEPIRLPAPELAERFPALEGIWLNLYDRNDVLAFPLGCHNNSYAETVIDVPLNVGGWLTSWNPLSHLEYWTDAEVVSILGMGLTHLVRDLTTDTAEPLATAKQFVEAHG